MWLRWTIPAPLFYFFIPFSFYYSPCLSSRSVLADRSAAVWTPGSDDSAASSFSFGFLLVHFHLVWPSSSLSFRFTPFPLYLSHPLLYFVLVSFDVPVSRLVQFHFTLHAHTCRFCLRFVLASPRICLCGMSRSSVLFLAFQFLSHLIILGSLPGEGLSWPLHVTVCYSDWGLCSVSSFFFLPATLVISRPLSCSTSLLLQTCSGCCFLLDTMAEISEFSRICR